MKPFLWNLADWCVLAIIVWAHDINTLTAERLLDAASVWVWIVNTLTVIYMFGLVSFKSAREHLTNEVKARTRFQAIHHCLIQVSSVAVFAYTGWIGSLVIRLCQIFLIELINIKKTEIQYFADNLFTHKLKISISHII